MGRLMPHYTQRWVWHGGTIQTGQDIQSVRNPRPWGPCTAPCDHVSPWLRICDPQGVMETPWVVMQHLPWFDFTAVPMAERNCSRPHALSYVQFSYQSVDYWWYFPPLSSHFWSSRSLLTLLAVRVWRCLGFVSRRCQAGKMGDAIHA